MKIKKNPSIPSTMTSDGLDFLGMMAKSVPQNGVIVEIGPLFGSSTWVLAKNAHPSVRIFSIDTWEPAEWIDKVEQKFKNCKPFSKEAFLHYTRDCPNVTAIQGWSPEVVKDWDLPIDMFFDDATHGDPGFSENVNFFLPFIKDRGIFCGDDYSVGWPDIVRVVDDFGDRWGIKPEVSGRVWAMRKPEKNATTKSKIYDSVNEDQDKPAVQVKTTSLSGQEYDLSNGVWSGALHKKDRLKSISIDSNWRMQGLKLQWKIKDGKGVEHGPFSSGDTYTCEPNDWISGFSSSLVGPKARAYKINYQAAFCWYLEGGKRYPISYNKPNNVFVEEDNTKIAISAIKVTIIKKNLANRISSFINILRYQTSREIIKRILSKIN